MGASAKGKGKSDQRKTAKKDKLKGGATVARTGANRTREKKGKTPAVRSGTSKPKPSATKQEAKGSEDYPHFRRYFPGQHPALIVGERQENKDEYRYRKVMHDDKDGRHLNEKISPNPNRKDPNPMYIGRRVRHDKKSKFSTWKYPWKYPNKKT